MAQALEIKASNALNDLASLRDELPRVLAQVKAIQEQQQKGDGGYHKSTDPRVIQVRENLLKKSKGVSLDHESCLSKMTLGVMTHIILLSKKDDLHVF
ncbi:hypothetical protein [Helicobacter ailurogastricus]|uniref:hypothetical protein n=1 Tax=Helicobacter ailurogastricus TaxID=1578720 RepID=UPI0022BED6CE|nr:hypothetical protein [Helicobacter ailurogastricus]GLH57473.1 hypothetical protein NHP214376_02600 [Helicobacter ailurogastricus]GLH59429.1 hypothetical protein NHP214377_06960 [Helicobacter ailurogastricus]